MQTIPLSFASPLASGFVLVSFEFLFIVHVLSMSLCCHEDWMFVESNMSIVYLVKWFYD